MARALHGRGMASVNQTGSHCVNQMGKTHSKPIAARHARGTAWERHAVCESAFEVPSALVLMILVFSDVTLCSGIRYFCLFVTFRNPFFLFQDGFRKFLTFPF